MRADLINLLFRLEDEEIEIIQTEDEKTNTLLISLRVSKMSIYESDKREYERIKIFKDSLFKLID